MSMISSQDQTLWNVYDFALNITANLDSWFPSLWSKNMSPIRRMSKTSDSSWAVLKKIRVSPLELFCVWWCENLTRCVVKISYSTYLAAFNSLVHDQAIKVLNLNICMYTTYYAYFSRLPSNKFVLSNK